LVVDLGGMVKGFFLKIFKIPALKIQDFSNFQLQLRVGGKKFNKTNRSQKNKKIQHMGQLILKNNNK
jgi:hypothetical protein